MGNNIGYLKSNRINSELYTPYYAVEPLLKYLPKDKIYWCPFDPEWSAFYQLLKNNGFKVIRSSIQEGYDFFKYEPEEWDIVISNPPFNVKDQILERLYSFNKPFALLLPLNSLQGKNRADMYINNGIQLLTFDGRISFHNPWSMYHEIKGTPFASAYFCRDLLPKDLIIEKLKYYDEPLRKEDLYLVNIVMAKCIDK